MSVLLIQQALEIRLAALDSTLTVFSNTGSSPPTNPETLYQRAYFLPAEPDNSMQTTKQYLEIGIFQVTIAAAAGKGPGEASTRAGLLRNHFKRGTTLTQGGVTVLITHTPTVHQGYDMDGRWLVPVDIRWQALVIVA